ncbi:hypothetical protein [Frankia sp. CcWB2]
MTGNPKDQGGRWPAIDNGVSRDHRCLLLFFHLLHALYQVPWKSCCSLPVGDPGHDAEKKKIERRFTGKTKLDWDQIVCYLNKLPEPDRESATLTAFCLFKRWCEGSRAGRTTLAKEEASRALEAAEAATADRDWPAVAWLLAIPVAGMPVTTTSPIAMVPAAAADPLVATAEVSVAPTRATRAAHVPRADLEEVERQLAAALERARQDGERAEAADQRLEEADRVRGDLRARLIELGARCQQAEEDRDATLATAAAALASADAADADATEARALAAAAKPRSVNGRPRLAGSRRQRSSRLPRIGRSKPSGWSSICAGGKPTSPPASPSSRNRPPLPPQPPARPRHRPRPPLTRRHPSVGHQPGVGGRGCPGGRRPSSAGAPMRTTARTSTNRQA